MTQSLWMADNFVYNYCSLLPPRTPAVTWASDIPAPCSHQVMYTDPVEDCSRWVVDCSCHVE